MTTPQPAALPECIAHVEDWPDDRTPIGLVWDADPKSVPVGTKLYALTTSQPAQAGDEHHVLCDGDIEELAIFHAPPIHPDFKDDDDFVEFGRAIERKVIQRMLTSLPTQPAAQATPEPVDWKPIKTSAGGREAVRSFFRSTLKRHDFDDYITGALAADFACVLGGYLQATTTPPQQAAGEPVGYQRIFDAIRAATSSPAKGVVEVSVTNFTRQIGGNIYTHPAPGVPEGWKEAAIAWEVCASVHRQWAKGKDALFSTRQADYEKHAEDARKQLAAAQAKGGEHA